MTCIASNLALKSSEKCCRCNVQEFMSLLSLVQGGLQCPSQQLGNCCFSSQLTWAGYILQQNLGVWEVGWGGEWQDLHRLAQEPISMNSVG